MIPSQIHASSASASASAGAKHASPPLSDAISREVIQQVHQNQQNAQELIHLLMSKDPAVEQLGDLRQQYLEICFAVRDNIRHSPKATGPVSEPRQEAWMKATALPLPLRESNRQAALEDKSDLDRVMKNMVPYTQGVLADLLQQLQVVNNAIQSGLPQDTRAPITVIIDQTFESQASMRESPTPKDLLTSTARGVLQGMLKTAESVNGMVQTVKTYEQTVFTTSRSLDFYSRFGQLTRQAYQFAALGDRKSFDVEIQKIRDLINKLGVSEATSTDSSV
jgi:hypothetical protein